MQITLDIPEAFAAQMIAAGKDPAREALESLAVERYRAGQLSEEEVRAMLGFGTRMQVHAVLKSRGAYLDYTVEDLDDDCETIRQARAADSAAA